jgi:hypothetical protein
MKERKKDNPIINESEEMMKLFIKGSFLIMKKR